MIEVGDKFLRNILEAAAHKCSAKKVFLEISQNSQENRPEASNFIKKENLAQVFHTTVKYGLAKMDQENLALKVEQWKLEYPNMLFLCPYGQHYKGKCLK